MLKNAQSNMRSNYINGGPGVIISGLVWLIAAIITHFMGFKTGMIAFLIGGIMIAFLIGGMLIHPLSVVVSNQLKGQTPPPDKGLTRLSLLTLPLLFGGIYLAYTVSLQTQALFYPIMAIVIGLRYLIFQRVYGLRAFILLGIILIFMGILFGMLFFLQSSYWLSIPPAALPLAPPPALVGIIETAIGIYLTRRKC